jgi:hypothetical protein
MIAAGRVSLAPSPSNNLAGRQGSERDERERAATIGGSLARSRSLPGILANVTLYLLVVGVLLLVVMDLRRLVNRWDRPSPVEQRRRQWSLIGIAVLLLVVSLALGSR